MWYASYLMRNKTVCVLYIVLYAYISCLTLRYFGKCLNFGRNIKVIQWNWSSWSKTAIHRIFSTIQRYVQHMQEVKLNCQLIWTIYHIYFVYSYTFHGIINLFCLSPSEPHWNKHTNGIETFKITFEPLESQKIL